MTPFPNNKLHADPVSSDTKPVPSEQTTRLIRSTLLDPQALQPQFDNLAADLKQFIGNRQAIFIPNPGNWGDGLIFTGAKLFLEHYQIPVRMVHVADRKGKIRLGLVALRNLVTRNKAFVYCGNGAWCKVCDLGWRNVSRLSSITTKIFVMPTTFEWRKVKPEIRLYRRDNDESREFVPDSLFCHDMAFFMALIDPDKMLANRVAPTKKYGLILRTDNEKKSDRIIPEDLGNCDISAEGDYNTPVEGFFRYLDQFEHIITDRLHAAIGGVLLGKKVSLLQNNYWKIRAIFDASIRGVFSDAEMIDDAQLAVLLDKIRNN